jgi:hypothetical protein
MRRLVTGLTSSLRRAGAAVAGELGRDEVLFLTALGLIARGLWDVWAPGVWIVPGVALLWVYLPARVGFVVRPDQKQPPRRAE